MAWFCTPKLATIALASFSNSAGMAGFDKVIATITGFPFMAFFVSWMVLRSFILAAVMLFPLYDRLVIPGSTGSPAAMLCSLASAAV